MIPIGQTSAHSMAIWNPAVVGGEALSSCAEMYVVTKDALLSDITWWMILGAVEYVWL